MLGISFTEFLIIGVVALLALGPEKLPQLLKTVGKVLREFRRATRELRDQLDVDGTLREALGEPPLRRAPTPATKPPSRIYPPEGVDSEGVQEEPADSPYPGTVPYASEEVLPPPAEDAAAALDAIPRTIGITAPGPAPRAATAPVSWPPPSAPPATRDELDLGWGDADEELTLAPRVSLPTGAAAPPAEPPPERGRSQRWRKGKKPKATPAEAAPTEPAKAPAEGAPNGGTGGRRKRRR